MNISLPENLKEKIQERISDGQFDTPSEYLHHLVKEDMSRQDQQVELKRLIQEGIDSGICEQSGEQVFADLREHIARKSL